MTQSPSHLNLTQQRQHTTNALIAQRRVRAVAYAGSFGTKQAWLASTPHILCFARGLNTIREERTNEGIHITHLPFEPLERASDWPSALNEMQTGQLELGRIATCRPVYDPSKRLKRLQDLLLTLQSRQQEEWHALLTQQATQKLNRLTQILDSNVASSTYFYQLYLTGEVRLWAVKWLYPALLARENLWVDTAIALESVRLPHRWRTQLELTQPRASTLLSHLYSFGEQPEAEAEAVLRAARGLGLEAIGKYARSALTAGYADGVVRLMCDATFAMYAETLTDWRHFSTHKQAKLSTLLRLERAPIGAGAVALAEELLNLARS